MTLVQLQPAKILISGTIFDCLIPRDGIFGMPTTTKREEEHFIKPMASNLSSLCRESQVNELHLFFDDLTPLESLIIIVILNLAKGQIRSVFNIYPRRNYKQFSSFGE